MTKFEHGASVAFVLVGVVCHFAISMENNDSRLLGVKKAEFKRVMREILHGTNDTTGDTKSADQEYDEDSSIMRIPSSPRTLATQEAQAKGGNRSKQAKHDSFYFLHKSLEERDKKLKESKESSSQLFQRKLAAKSSGSSGRRSKLVQDAEDLMFHDSYSEASSDFTPERLLRSKLV